MYEIIFEHAWNIYGRLFKKMCIASASGQGTSDWKRGKGDILLYTITHHEKEWLVHH